jgi:hypothetical protein
MTDFLEYFTLQNTNSNPQLRDLTLLDLHQRPLRGTKHGSQNREPHTLSTNIFSLLNFAVTETLAQGRDLRIPRDLSSIIKKQGQGHDSTPPSRISSAPDSLRTLALATNTRPSEMRSLDPAAESEGEQHSYRCGHDSPWQPAAPNSSCAAPRSGSPGRSWEEQGPGWQQEQDAHMDFSFLENHLQEPQPGGREKAMVSAQRIK